MQEFTIRINNPLPRQNVIHYIKELPDDKEFTIKISQFRETRTSQQNKSIHLYCTLVANKLNGGGVMRIICLQGIPSAMVEWTPDSVKEHLWRDIQIALVGKESTTTLETHEVSQVYEFVNLYLTENYNAHVPFPHRHHS